jgi:hypothetical protein
MITAGLAGGCAFLYLVDGRYLRRLGELPVYTALLASPFVAGWAARLMLRDRGQTVAVLGGGVGALLGGLVGLFASWRILGGRWPAATLALCVAAAFGGAFLGVLPAWSTADAAGARSNVSTPGPRRGARADVAGVRWLVAALVTAVTLASFALFDQIFWHRPNPLELLYPVWPFLGAGVARRLIRGGERTSPFLLGLAAWAGVWAALATMPDHPAFGGPLNREWPFAAWLVAWVLAATMLGAAIGRPWAGMPAPPRPIR